MTMASRARLTAMALILLVSSTGHAGSRPESAPPKSSLPEASSALEDYVKRPDNSYAWHVRQRGKQGGGDYAELILTSQTWHDIVWKHQLFIYRPAKIKDSKQALLLIDGGSWSDSLAAKPDKAKPDSLPDKVLLDHDAGRHDANAHRRRAASARATDLRRPQRGPDHRPHLFQVSSKPGRPIGRCCCRW